MKSKNKILLLVLFIVLLAALASLVSCAGDDDDDDNDADDDAVDDDDADDDLADDDIADDDAVDDDAVDDDAVDDDVVDDDTDISLETHDPYQAVQNILPASVESCPIIAETNCREGSLHECAIFDAAADEFAENPPEFVQQIYYLDRYADKYLSTEHSGVTFQTSVEMPPCTEESIWADPENFENYHDFGDGAFYMGMYLSAAAMRYAVSGTEANYERMVGLLEKQLNNWRVTGVPGYMVRSTFAMLDEGVAVPQRHPEYALHAHKERTNHVLYTVGEQQLQFVPDYYHQGVTIDDAFYKTTPTSEGSPSLDAYSGAILSQEKAWSLLRPEDQNQKDEIVQNVTCFLKRMRKMRITNLSTSVIGRLAVEYLTGSGSYHPDPDDIQFDEIDTMIGYVQEAIPPADPGDFEFGCPDQMPTEVDPKYDFDAASPVFLLQLADLALKLSGQGGHSIDFIYFVSHRGGDLIFLLNYAAFAYHATGESQYLEFIRNNLIDEIRGLEVINTAGSFYLPPYCGSWIGGDLVHPIMYGTLKIIGEDVIADEMRRALKEEMKDKLFINDNNAYFGITYGSVVDQDFDPDLPAYTDWAVQELANYKLNAECPLDPKRTYGTDYIENPLPDPEYWPTPPTQEQIDACETGLEVFGFELIPGPGIDPDFELLAQAPLPIQFRVPHDLIWHFSPFNLKRDYGSRDGRAHFMFADLTMPFWIGRYHGQIDSGAEMTLAWEDAGVPCDDLNE